MLMFFFDIGILHQVIEFINEECYTFLQKIGIIQEVFMNYEETLRYLESLHQEQLLKRLRLTQHCFQEHRPLCLLLLNLLLKLSALREACG